MSLARSRARSLALFLSVVAAPPAHAGWGADPVQVHATSALCPAVAAVSDGHGGAVIAWQENDATGGLIRAQHLLASGDLDPVWGASVPVTDLSVPRTVLGAVPAGPGGAYLWWMEGSYLYLQRITTIGTVAPGWPARGRLIAALLSADYRPVLAPDEASGVYIGMLTGPWTYFDVRVNVRHLNVSGGGASGWPLAGREFGFPLGFDGTVSSFALDPVPGGGLWLAWQSLYSTVGSYAGQLRLLRLTVGGLPATGWTTTGDSLAPFFSTYPMNTFPPDYQEAPHGSQVGVAHDGADGAFVLSRQPQFNSLTLETDFQNSLHHVDASGAPAPGWTGDGVILSAGPEYVPAAPSAEASVRAFADDRGGVFNGLPFYASEFTAGMNFSRRASDGDPLPGGIGTDQHGIEFAPRGDGGMFAASFKPSGATGPYEADAYILVNQSDPGAPFYESKPSFYDTRYGDIGLTTTGDGGAIFAWSQLIDRQGIYAIRLGQAGPVTGVTPTPVVGPPSLRVRFVRGEGVHAVASLAGAASVRLSLHDLIGRRVAARASDATLGADVVIPGTRDLPGGVYFARASDGLRVLNARVIVLP